MRIGALARVANGEPELATDGRERTGENVDAEFIILGVMMTGATVDVSPKWLGGLGRTTYDLLGFWSSLSSYG